MKEVYFLAGIAITAVVLLLYADIEDHKRYAPQPIPTVTVTVTPLPLPLPSEIPTPEPSEFPVVDEGTTAVIYPNDGITGMSIYGKDVEIFTITCSGQFVYRGKTLGQDKGVGLALCPGS